MKTDYIKDCLKDIILLSDTPVEECHIERGINFLCPPPKSPAKGTVFAGTLSEWKMLCEMHLVYPTCSYLICTDGEHYAFEAPKNRIYNLFVTNSSVKTVLNKLTNLLVSRTALSDTQQYKLYHDFWHSIMDGSLDSRETVLEYMQQFPYQMHAHIACIVITYDLSELDSLQMREIDIVLKNFFKETNLFFYNSEWIILFSQSKDTSVDLDLPYDEFSLLLEQYQLSAGICYACQLPEQFRTLYLTASASVQLGKSLKLKPYIKKIYTYHQFNPYYVIHLCSQKFTEIYNTKNIVYLAHPDVVRLYYYDLENKGNLLDVLFAYLSCGQNLSSASKMLYMHRNTVLNKLNKIEEFLNHKPFTEKDHFLMLLSCMIIKYQCIENDLTKFFPL